MVSRTRRSVSLGLPRMSGNFEEIWNNNFAGELPAGYVLRSAYASRWVRFHYWPNSKRYPENESEFQTLLKRVDTIARDCLALDQDLWMVASLYDNSRRSDQKRWHKDVRMPHKLTPAFKWSFDINDAEAGQYTAFAGRCRWSIEAFDQLIRQIADGTYAHLLWLDPYSGIVFAPYEGGIDIVLPSEYAAAALKTKYADWFSDL